MDDETSLEETFRSGLQARADDVDTRVDLLGPARAVARTRQRRRWVVAGGAGLVAAALVAFMVAQDPSRSGPPDDAGPQVVDEGPAPEPPPVEWRAETWHGLTVDVPADWGWGTAPITMSFDSRSRLLCGGPGRLVRADGERLVNPDRGTPWVGRPVMLSDDCLGEPYPPPDAPYVWLGADLPTGAVDVGNGYTQETVEVGGTTLTVASDDPQLADRILASARGSTECAPSLDSAPTVDSMLTEGLRDPTSAQVCAYGREEGAATWELVYATTLDAAQATAYHAQVYDGGRDWKPDFCNASSRERVLVTIVGDDPYGDADVSQDTVVDPHCAEVSGSPGMVSPLSEAGMAAWSSNGVQTVLPAFIGVLG